jgi:protein-S-isoprenylcysteine O-methyltransferase Ste14
MAKDYSIHYQDIIVYILMIVCFPLNPLVLLNIVEPQGNDVLTFIGIFVWIVGMIFVIYPLIYFKRKGDVRKGKSYVHTNRMVTSGLYSIVRHVQYTGGILSIFFTTPFLYPHWIFVVLGIPGIYLTYLSAKREDDLMIKKFGNDYREYMQKVPGVNLFAGLIRKIIKVA